MAFCKNCGNELGNQNVCPNCGANQSTDVTVPEDKGGFLWGLLGCCIPIVGLVLFLVWKDTKPQTAKSAGIGAIVGVALAVLYYVVIIGLGALSMFV